MCCEAARSRGRRDLGDLMAVKYKQSTELACPATRLYTSQGLEARSRLGAGSSWVAVLDR